MAEHRRRQPMISAAIQPRESAELFADGRVVVTFDVIDRALVQGHASIHDLRRRFLSVLLRQRGSNPHSIPPIVVSPEKVRLGEEHAARRLFCFFADGTAFPEEQFRLALSPWLQKDRAEVGDAEMPREGVGCWHPVFPARADDVWMMASIAVKHLEETLKSGTPVNGLTVFEQQFNGSAFTGVARVPFEAVNG